MNTIDTVIETVIETVFSTFLLSYQELVLVILEVAPVLVKTYETACEINLKVNLLHLMRSIQNHIINLQQAFLYVLINAAVLTNMLDRHCDCQIVITVSRASITKMYTCSRVAWGWGVLRNKPLLYV